MLEPGIDVPHQHWHCEVVYSSFTLHVIYPERSAEMGEGRLWVIFGHLIDEVGKIWNSSLFDNLL